MTNVPTDRKTRQRIRYARGADGVQLAWADAGAGPVVVKAANWLTHLEYEWESPVWRHWIRFFTDHFRFIRYDERGCGMSDWQCQGLSFDQWVGDLEAVIAAAEPREPFTLLGISQGASACIAYAARYPERVSRLLLYGAYARGWSRRGDSAGEREYSAITDLVRAGWGRDNPVFRQVFTSRFVPGASSEQMDWFNELCLKTTTPENAATILSMRASIDVTGLLGQVKAPTLVIHGRNDVVVPISEGRLLGSAIPGAEFVELDSANHILLESEPAWGRFREAVLQFMGSEAEALSGAGHPVFQSLSPREREILALISEGLANAEIAARLAISEKTVRNHVSNLFDKLGVWSRAQAIVFARDHGFSG